MSPKWRNWFASYTEFQKHYAKIAQETGCEMHIAGCEMVMAERRAAEWRQTIAEIRSVFKGTRFLQYRQIPKSTMLHGGIVWT